MQIHYGVCLANGVLEADRKRPFELLLANFLFVERTLPKGRVTDDARRNPLAIVKLEPIVAHEVALALNIAQVPCEKGDPTGVDCRE